MRLLIDTNILLDLFACREEFVKEAYALKGMALCKEAELWVSAKSFTDVFYLMNREKEFKSDQIQDMFLDNLTYLNVCGIDKEDIVESALSKWPDFEDCLVARCADKIKADVLLTRDKKGFERSNVAWCSPADFFDRLKKEYGIVYDVIDW